VDLSDDLPPPRRPLFFPVVIATTFLSIIGMSVGLLLGSQRDRDTTPDAGPTQVVDTVPTVTSPRPKPTGKPCRPETQAAAQRAGQREKLYVVLTLQTKTSIVFICESSSGDLYYHANNGGNTWVEGETALFLTGVTEQDDGYHVTATDGTEFTVSADRLLILHQDGTEEEQPAVR
jgi:hypothetical protein